MKFNRNMIIFFTLAIALTILAGCVGSDEGEISIDSDGTDTNEDTESSSDATVLRLASDAPLEHIADELNNELADIIKEKTEGRVEIKYFPASQLGGYETVYEEIMRGSIDAAQITIPDSLDPKLGSAYMPYYATNFEEAEILFAPDSFLAEETAKLTKEHDVSFLGFVLEGFIGHGYVKEPKDIFTPDSNKGVKTRSPAITTFRIPHEELGFGPITVPYDEVPTAIQTKVIDGWVGGTPNMNYAWVGEIINHMYVNYMFAEATSYVVSDKTLESLSEDDAEVVKEAFTEQSKKSFTLAEENEEEYKQKLADDYDVEVVEFTEEQIDEYANFVREKTWPLLEDELTKEFVDGMRNEIEKLQ